MEDFVFDICKANNDNSKDNKMTLTSENYFSKEANKKYMSVSKYKNYMQCEFAAKARDEGLYIPDKSVALLQGSYLDAWCNGELDKFKANHPELYSSQGPTKGQLKSDFKKLHKPIETLENDPLCMEYLSGQKQVIFTAKLFDVDWKICVDNYNPDKGRFTDLKCMDNFEWKWDDGTRRKVSFVELYGYNIQMAIYRKVIELSTGLLLEPFIVAVTKQEVPDKAIILFDKGELRGKLDEVEENLDRIMAVNDGDAEPIKCEKCEYCRQTKKLRIEDIRHHALI